MSGCPYTWIKGFFGSSAASADGAKLDSTKLAKNLHVKVMKDGEERVRVTLPAQSARWLIELIPADVVEKIYAENIPLDEVLDNLKEQKTLYAMNIFSVKDVNRQVDIWLE